LSVKLVQIDNNSVVNSFASKDNGPAISIAMSHDGEMLAVSYWVDDVVRLWKVDNKKLLHTLAEGGRKISFSYDNSMVGILYGKELKVWNTSNGQVVYSLTDNVESFSFSPENDMLVLGLSDGTISLRRFLDGSLVSTLSGHTSSVQSLAFSSDGKVLASASSDETIKLWDMLNKKLLRSVNSNVGGISYLIFSKDGQLLASGADDGTTTLWSLTR
jgi:WD40 repeat protein